MADQLSLQQKFSGKRLISLDVFRGGTIAAMILVNNPGSWQHMYAPLQHADWHGWTVTDLIFPFFLVSIGYVWDWFFPINKPIWTSSYAVFTAGLGIFEPAARR